jgi:hypothetical protein
LGEKTRFVVSFSVHFNLLHLDAASSCSAPREIQFTMNVPETAATTDDRATEHRQTASMSLRRNA